MLTKLNFLLGTLVLLLPLGASATGMHQCDVTKKSDWMSKSELEEKLEAVGWAVRFMKEDGGCWEVYGTNPEGVRVEAYFHPVTGEPEVISARGRILFDVGKAKN